MQGWHVLHVLMTLALLPLWFSRINIELISSNMYVSFMVARDEGQEVLQLLHDPQWHQVASSSWRWGWYQLCGSLIVTTLPSC